MRGQAVSHWREKGGGVLGRGEEMGRAREAGWRPARERGKVEWLNGPAVMGRKRERWANAGSWAKTERGGEKG
jgi:hypothetical protein